MEGKTSATVVVRSVSKRIADLKTTIVDFKRRVLRPGELTRVSLYEDSNGVPIDATNRSIRLSE